MKATDGYPSFITSTKFSRPPGDWDRRTGLRPSMTPAGGPAGAATRRALPPRTVECLGSLSQCPAGEAAEVAVGASRV